MEDQLNLLQNLNFSDVDPKKVVDVFTKGESVEDQLVDMYLAKDLPKLQKMSEMFNEKTEKMLLSNRNRNMLQAMDSIMSQKSLFCAVGSLHLPGKMGLITLLREKGYRIEPVFTTGYIHGADYKYKNNPAPWVTIVSEKDGCSYRMPGTPSEADGYSGTVKMKTYFDLSTSRTYLLCHMPLPQGAESAMEAVVKSIEGSMINGARDVKNKHIKHEGMEGTEYSFTDKEAVHYRLQILNNNTDLFMMMLYSKSWDIRNVDSFFSSLKLIDKNRVQLVKREFKDIFVTTRLPDITPTRKLSYESDSNQFQVMYTVADPSIGAYYFVVCNQTNRGNYYTVDSIWTTALKESFNGNGARTKVNHFTDAHYSIDEFTTDTINNLMIKARIIYAGNKVYKLMVQFPAGAGNEAVADTFLNSTVVTPVAPATGHTEVGADGLFSATAPAPFVLDRSAEQDDTTAPAEHLYESWDKDASITYFVTQKRLSNFYWKGNDSEMVTNWLKLCETANDTLPVRTFTRANGRLGGESQMQKMYTRQLHSVKVVSDGRTRYILNCIYPIWMKQDTNIKRFFSSFTILKHDTEQMQPSPAVFFTALHHADTNISYKALNSFNQVFFYKQDAAALIREAGTTFPDDTLDYGSTRATLINAVANLAGDLPLNAMEDLYLKENAKKSSLALRILDIMMQHNDTTAAIKKVNNLLLTQTPANGYTYSLNFQLRKHPHLTAALYPALWKLSGDSIVGGMVNQLSGFLIDSGYMEKSLLLNNASVIIDNSREARKSISYATRSEMLQLLGRIKSPAAIAEMKLYQFAEQNWTRYLAVRNLLEIGEQPEARIIDTLAADKTYRLELHSLLAENNKPSLFPKKYLNQQYFAEAYMAAADEEDGYFTQMKLLGMRKATYQGRKQKFFLYELRTGNDTDKPVLGITGPFSDNEAVLEIVPDDNITGYAEEPLMPGKLEKQLDLYLLRRKMAENDIAPPIKVN
jgi:hypothetical protein